MGVLRLAFEIEIEMAFFVSVASARGSPQLGGGIPILSRIRFLYRVSTGDLLYGRLFFLGLQHNCQA
jgi:hypothetical protein